MSGLTQLADRTVGGIDCGLDAGIALGVAVRNAMDLDYGTVQEKNRG